MILFQYFKSSGTQNHRLGFTLIELLVTIAIISILASLLLPALRSIKANTMSIKCVSNLKQVGCSMIGYASENDGWTPIVYDSVSNYTWSQLLVYSNFMPTNTMTLSCDSVFVCPSLDPSGKWNSPSKCYGMRYYGATVCTYDQCKYRIQSDDVILGNNISFGSPSSFLLVGDSYLDYPAQPTYDRKQSYYFIPNLSSSASNKRMVHLRHGGKGNFLFGDGHVENLMRDQLVGHYGSTTNYLSFTDAAIY